MPLFLLWAARLAKRETSLSRRATADIPMSLHFFWARETNIIHTFTKILRIEAEETHKPANMLIFVLFHLDPTLWQVENSEYSPRDAEKHVCVLEFVNNRSAIPHNTQCNTLNMSATIYHQI